MNKPLSFADVSMLALACGILKDRGVWTVYLNHATPEVFINDDAFVSALRATPAPLDVKPHGTAGHYKASFVYGGMTVYALLKADDLHRVGYRLVEPPPVMPVIAEGATP